VTGVQTCALPICKGSTFWARARFGRAKNLVPRIQSDQTIRGMPVLVVDDSDDAREIHGGYLESFGCVVTPLPGGQSALALLAEAAPDAFPLVVLDYQMPDLDGMRTCEALRATNRHPGTRVIMITGSAHTETQGRAKAAGVDVFLIKPISPSSLFDAIVGLFGAGAAKVDQNADAAETARAHLSGARILLAEDNDINQQVAQGILEDIGIHLDIAADGRLALGHVRAAQIAGRPYDAVLMDMQMPEMDGLTATRELRKDPRNDNLPIIAMTANAMAGDREACIKAGMNDHVAKPLNVGRLFATLMKWVPAQQGRAAAVPVVLATEPLQALTPVPPPAPAVAMDSPIPVLRGVNTAAGLERIGGKPARYLDVLRRFRDSQAAVPEQIEDACGSGDVALAVRLAHTLRGTAATLGADGLAAIAGELEAALKSGDGTWRQRLGETQAQLLPLIASLRSALPDAAAAAPAVKAAEATIAPAVLIRLAGQIESFDSEAAETVAVLRESLGDAAPTELAVIDEHLANFAFDDAGVVLASLKQRVATA
jgi:two-component system sensor histidine kinase/response regulator